MAAAKQSLAGGTAGIPTAPLTPLPGAASSTLLLTLEVSERVPSPAALATDTTSVKLAGDVNMESPVLPLAAKRSTCAC
jgi:hypothetical protein